MEKINVPIRPVRFTALTRSSTNSNVEPTSFNRDTSRPIPTLPKTYRNKNTCSGTYPAHSFRSVCSCVLTPSTGSTATTHKRWLLQLGDIMVERVASVRYTNTNELTDYSLQSIIANQCAAPSDGVLTPRTPPHLPNPFRTEILSPPTSFTSSTPPLFQARFWLAFSCTHHCLLCPPVVITSIHFTLKAAGAVLVCPKRAPRGSHFRYGLPLVRYQLPLRHPPLARPFQPSFYCSTLFQICPITGWPVASVDSSDARRSG